MAGGAEQAGQQGGAHDAQVRGDGVEQRQRLDPRFHLLEQARLHEGVSNRFQVAAIDQGIAQAALVDGLLGNGLAGGGTGRHPAGQLLIAVDARQFLDQVGFDGHVEAPAGGQHHPFLATFLGGHFHAQAAEDVFHLFGGQTHAEQAFDAVCTQGDFCLARQVCFIHGFADRTRLAAGDLQDQGGGPFDGLVLQLRVHAPLEAVGGIRVQTVGAGLAGDGQGGKEGALQEDVPGVAGDGGRLAAHDTSQGQGIAVVGDHQGVVAQGQFLVVQGEQCFLGLGLAHGDAAVELGEIEGMQGLAQFQQHIVGHVDDGIDGAQAGAAQALDQPQGAVGVHVDALDNPAQVTGAAFAVRQGHGEGVVDGRGHLVDVHVGQRALVHHPHFPGDATHAQAVGAVGGQVHFDDRIVELQVVADIGAHWGVFRQFHQAIDEVFQAQLGGAAEHAVGFLAAQLGFLDLEVTGQYRAHLGEGNFQAGAHVGRAADYLHCVFAIGDLADAEFVRIRVLFAAFHLTDHHAGEDRGGGFHGVHFQAGHGQLLHQGIGIDGGVDPFPQPGFVKTHCRIPLNHGSFCMAAGRIRLVNKAPTAA